MPVTILTGAAASGKTTTVLHEILNIQDFGQEVWVLLPTRLQIDAFRDHLMQETEAIFNVRFFNFYELYDLLLDIAGDPQRTLYQAATDRILNEIIHRLLREGALTYYHQIASKAGFIKLVDKLIKELKQGVVKIEDFETFASTPKDKDLARIYREYQLFLQTHDLVDRDGAGWLAVDHLRTNVPLIEKVRDVGLLVVDGYDSFTPLQAQLLASLVNIIPQSILTLTYEEHRKDGAHRTFDQTLNRLIEKGFKWDSQSVQPRLSPKPIELRHLESQLFSPKPEKMSGGEVLHCIESPNPKMEARAVMRDIKKRLLAGVRPDEILVVMRDATTYADALRGAALAYGLPVIVRQADSVLQNPVIAAILQLLDVHDFDFPRRQLMDILRNPYLHVPHLTTEQVNDLERISLEKPIVQGRMNWLKGLEAGVLHNEDNDSMYAIPAGLKTSVEAFFVAITPPESATPRAYVRWIQQLLGTDPQLEKEEEPILQPVHGEGNFSVYNQIRGQGDGAVMVRDLHAMHALRNAMQEILSAYDLLAETAHQGQMLPIPWSVFRADLELVLQNRRMENDLHSRVGRVLVTTVFEARGLSHRHVYIVGLSEGIFPAQQQEDPLYSNRERHFMSRVHQLDVQTAEERAVDSGLFYQMCSLAKETLTLSRPALDEKGNAWPESIFWKSVLDILQNPPLSRTRLGEVHAPTESANPREMLVSLGGALRQTPEKITADTWAMVRGLDNDPLWQNVLRGRKIESDRESSRSPFDHYTGKLSDPYFIAIAAKMLTERTWSATQMNELGQCRFRFFSKRLLKLDPYQEPEEGMDVMQLGSLNHKILEETYRRLENALITAENQTLALATLHQVAGEVFQSAPQEFGFQETRLWEQEKQTLLEKLERVVKTDFSPLSPLENLGTNRQTFAQELPFGAEGEPTVKIEGVAGILRARGYIDRIDRSDNGLIVMDYKSGRTPETKDMREGRNFQMMLYLLAMEQHLQRHGMDEKVSGGLFWSIHQNKARETVAFDAEEVELARQKIHQHVLAARDGDFANQPAKLEGGKCSHYCEFNQFCRMNRASLRKHS